MKKVILAIVALSYVSGSGPWCGADDFGNLNCFYWSYSACVDNGSYAACVPNPKR